MRSSSSSKCYLPKINLSLMDPKNLLRINRVKDLICNDVRGLSLLPQLLLYVQPSFEKKSTLIIYLSQQHHSMRKGTNLLEIQINYLEGLFSKHFLFSEFLRFIFKFCFSQNFGKCSQKCRQRSFFSYVLRRCNKLLKPAT